MRREAMVEGLRRKIKEVREANPAGWSSYYLADIVLKFVEDAGMTPPVYETGEQTYDPDLGMLPVIERKWE